MFFWRSRKKKTNLGEPKYWRSLASLQSFEVLLQEERSTLPLDILSNKWKDEQHQFSADGENWYAPTDFPFIVFKSGKKHPLAKRYAIPDVRDALRSNELGLDDKILVSIKDKKPIAWPVYQLKAFCTYDVFISYRHSSKKEAQELKRLLETGGLRVWIDSERMNPGGAVDGQLYTGVKESSGLVALFTNNDADKSAGEVDYCKQERTFAKKNRKEIYPIRMRRVTEVDQPEFPDDVIAGDELGVDLVFKFHDKAEIEKLASRIMTDARSQSCHRPPSVAATQLLRRAEDYLRLLGLPANTLVLVVVLISLIGGIVTLGFALSELKEKVVALESGEVNQILVDVREGESSTYSSNKIEGEKKDSKIHLSTKAFPPNVSPMEKMLSLRSELQRSSRENRNALLVNWSGRKVAEKVDVRWRVTPKRIESRNRIDTANALGDMIRIIQADIVRFLSENQIRSMEDDWILAYFAGDLLLIVHERNPSDELGVPLNQFCFQWGLVMMG
ncbi:MAG: toll/interleukin-1 receptor domain-containing protein [Pirellulales bacterium]